MDRDRLSEERKTQTNNKMSPPSRQSPRERPIGGAALLVMALIAAATGGPIPAAHAEDTLSHRAPLSYMSTPGNYYFIGYPELNPASIYQSDETLSADPLDDPESYATCGDGSPFSFLYKRGSDENVNKVVIEFGNGLACWDDDSCLAALTSVHGFGAGAEGNARARHLRTPWHDDGDVKGAFGGVGTSGSCAGLPGGLASGGLGELFSEILEDGGANNTELPLGARGGSDADAAASSLGSIPAVSETWSYLYVPHCTADLHLGTSLLPAAYDTTYPTVYHRGGVNAMAVLAWLKRNMPRLDALVVAGCGAGGTGIPAVFASGASDLYRGVQIQAGFDPDIGAGISADQEGDGGSSGGGGDGDDVSIGKVYALSDSPFNPAALAMASMSAVTGGDDAAEKDGATAMGLAGGGNPLASWNPWPLFAVQGLTLSEKTAALPSAVSSLVRSHPAVRYGFYGLYATDSTAKLYESLGLDATTAAAYYNGWAAGMASDFPNFYAMKVDGGSTCSFAFGSSSGGGANDTSSLTVKEFEERENTFEAQEKWLTMVTDNWRDDHWDWDDYGDGGASSASSASALNAAASKEVQSTGGDGGFQPTFLFMIVVFLASFLTAWGLWHFVMWYQSRQAKKLRDERRAEIGGEDLDSAEDEEDDDANQKKCLSPLDLWLLLLTRYPFPFLLISLLVPVLFSWRGFEASNRTVAFNLDFETYLDIGTAEAAFDRTFRAAQEVQKEKVEEWIKGECTVLKEGPPDDEDDEGERFRRLMQDDQPSSRRLLAGKGRRLDIFYTHPSWSPDAPYNVFTPAALEEMRSLEFRIASFRGFEDACYQSPKGEGECAPIQSVVPRFYTSGGSTRGENGQLTEGSIERTLTELLGEGIVDRTDKYFSANNLGSNFTRTSIHLRKGADIAFFKDLHREILWPTDRDNVYKHVTFSWGGIREVAELEAADALFHDAKWAAGTILIVGLLVLLKIRNVFVFLAAMLGLVLSFPAAYYWYYVHFAIREIKVVQVSALFVMLGIGADDIFLMIDAYSQTVVRMGDDADPRERMKAAYRTAGGTMLVTTATSAVCFYSNAFSVVLIVREFGIFMGTVVLLNFAHVMTILPSAVLVNELYLAPLWRRVTARPRRCLSGCFGRYCCGGNRGDDTLNTSGREDTDEGGGREAFEDDDYSSDPAPASMVPDDDRTEGNTASSASPDGSGGKRRRSTARMGGTGHSINSNSSSSHEEGGHHDAHDRDEDVEMGGEAAENIAEGGGGGGMKVLEPQHGVGGKEEEEEDFKGIVDVERMNCVDRWLFSRYAPFVYRRRWFLIVLSLLISAALGALAYSNFAISEQGIILFKDDYNLGRVATLKNVYLKSFSKFKKEEGVSEAYAELIKQQQSQAQQGSGSGSTEGGVVAAAGAEATPAPVPPPPTKAPSSGAPTTSPATAPPSPKPTPAPTLRPTPSPVDAPTFAPASAPSPTNAASGGGEEQPGTTTTTPPAAAPTLTVGAGAGIRPSAPTLESTTAAPTDAPVVSASAPAAGGGGGVAPTTSTTPGTAPSPGEASSAGEGAGTGTGESAGTATETSGCLLPCVEGYCDAETSTCRCELGFGGSRCDVPNCPATSDGSFDCTPEGDCQPKQIQCTDRGECRPVDATDASKGEKCVCVETHTGVDCSVEIPKIFRLKEAFEVSVVWGIEQDADTFGGLWNANKGGSNSNVDGSAAAAAGFGNVPLRSSFDVSEPEVQAWILKVVKAARDPFSGLNVQDDIKTWIEIVQEQAEKNGVPFPVPKDAFGGYISLLVESSKAFRQRYQDELGTAGPGFGRDYLFAAVTLMAEIPPTAGDDKEREAMKAWEKFVAEINSWDFPAKAGPAAVQSDAFEEVRREDAIFSTTLATWVIANVVCLMIILVFTRNVALSFIVMVVIILLAICLMGFILAVLAIDFGPIEAIGVTIFIGLSANYALHVAHAYHNAPSSTRLGKIQLTVFSTASPIMASALSTIGACAFLLGCRLWLFVELGVILCSNTAMALVFSMLFLLSILAVMGPLPYKGEDQMHQCDFKALVVGKCCKKKSNGAEEVTVYRGEEPAVEHTEANNEQSIVAKETGELPQCRQPDSN